MVNRDKHVLIMLTVVVLSFFLMLGGLVFAFALHSATGGYMLLGGAIGVMYSVPLLVAAESR